MGAQQPTVRMPYDGPGDLSRCAMAAALMKLVRTVARDGTLDQEVSAPLRHDMTLVGNYDSNFKLLPKVTLIGFVYALMAAAATCQPSQMQTRHGLALAYVIERISLMVKFALMTLGARAAIPPAKAADAPTAGLP